MAAPRSTSLRALRTLSQQHPQSSFTPAEFRRNLHITGAQSARPANGPDRQSLYLSRSLADLKSECQKRSLGTGGSKAELVDRLSNHDVLQTRAFSIAMRKIDRQAFGGGSGSGSGSVGTSNNLAEKQHHRHFNTSRANKAVNDTSTVDFAYMPTDYSHPTLPAYMTNNNNNFPSASVTESQPRIPTPPDAYSHRPGTPSPSSSSPASSLSEPMKPEIHFVGELGADANGPSPMSEVVDNDSAEINPFDLTEQVGRARRNAAATSSGSQAQALPSYSSSESEGKAIVKELWGGFVEDVFGGKKARS